MGSEHLDPHTSGNGCLRQCPTPRGDAQTLITHSIDAAACLSRQRDFYHKCHRCMYRGESATFMLKGTVTQVVQAATRRDQAPASPRE